MWCHWKQATLWLKMGHFSEQSKCFSSFTGWKLSDSTLKIHQGLVKVLGSMLLHICLCQRMALFVSFRGQGQQNFQHSWLSQDSPTQRRRVCSCINCEGRSTHMSTDRKCLESLHSHWELSKRPPWQAWSRPLWKPFSWTALGWHEPVWPSGKALGW